MVLLYSHWLALPIHTRIKLADQLGIKKTGPTHVSNNTIQNDGFEIKNIEGTLTVDNLQKYTGSKETDIVKLWRLTVDKIEGKVPPVVEKPVENPVEELSQIGAGGGVIIPPVDKPVETVKKKPGRPKK